MIKKVGNWIFGSFFRTMGRFFFFLFFGFMLAMIISKNNISIKWTDLLGIETVKADTYLNPVNVNWKDGAGNSLPNFGYDEFYYQSASTNRQLDNYNAMIFQGQIDVTNSHGSYIEIPLDIRYSESIYDNDYSNNNVVCDHWTPTGNNNYYCDSWTNQEQTGVYETNSRPFLSIYAISVFTNGYVDVCNIDLSNNVVRCPVASTVNYNTIQDIRVFSNVYYGTSNILQTTYQIAFGKRVKLYKSDNTQEAIENQTQQQQQQHNQTISTITDTNTTEADTQATNFFSNFSSQDNGGISSIITAPLSAISGLVSATCTPITLPLPYLDNKTIVLPCMSAIYQEHFGAFFTIYQTIIFGAIAYRIVVSIFMMIQGFKNPDDDKIEVVDL